MASDPVVITQWNDIAFRTVFTEGARPIPVTAVYLGIVSAAMYNAVATADGTFEQYAWQPRAQAHASPQAAAAVAAHDVLTEYFPSSAAALDADLAASLAAVPASVGKVHGTRVGRQAADAIIELRRADGLGDVRPYTPPTGIGYWVPPATGVPPWLGGLGYVDPLVLASPTQIPLPGPNPVDSSAYAAEYREVKQYGARTGSLRTQEQTENAYFWNFVAIRQYQLGAIDLATRHGLDIADSSRLFAILEMGMADAVIACWRAKTDHSYWRPSTAITTLDDGDPATEPDPGWLPLVDNPPYGDYTSGHACISGAAIEAFSDAADGGSLDLNLISTFPGAPPSRHYDSAAQLDTDTMNGRIWLGLHFRKAMTDGNRLGHQVARFAIDHYFQPAS